MYLVSEILNTDVSFCIASFNLNGVVLEIKILMFCPVLQAST